MDEQATAARRMARLRGSGSLPLGRVGGTEVFFPLRDWIITFVVMGAFFLVLTVLDRDLQRQNLLALTGYLGIAVLLQSVLYILGSLAAAKLTGLRIAAVQLGPIRRMGRFVTYRDRGRRFFFFYVLRSIPTLIAWWICASVWGAGGGPAFAIVSQVCLLSVAFALLPTPGSDGQRIIQSLLWWLTGSVGKAARWSTWACLGLCLLLCYVASGHDGSDALLWLIAMFYLFVGVLSYLGNLSTAGRMRVLDRIRLTDVARPVALARPGAHRNQYPLDNVGMVIADGALLGAVDDLSVGNDPVDQHLLPCPAAPISVDERDSFAETFLGLVDEGCDVVMLGSGDRYAVLTMQDCTAVLKANRLLSYDGHLGMP